jgi:hypothetical protein
VFARKLLPFPVRLELLRLCRLPGWLVETPAIARTWLPESECDAFRYLLTSHASPLQRAPGAVSIALQHGKERNVALAARLRGFRPGLELHGERPARGVGGGLCQVSNSLYLLALCGE